MKPKFQIGVTCPECLTRDTVSLDATPAHTYTHDDDQILFWCANGHIIWVDKDGVEMLKDMSDGPRGEG